MVKIMERRTINVNEELARETTGLETDAKHFKIGEDSLTIENVELFNDQVQDYIDKFNKHSEALEEYAQSIVENCNNLEIMPIGNYVLIKPFATNPFQKIQVTESGLITDLGGRALSVKSNDTGEYEEEEQFIMTGNVIEVGPDCKYIKEGDAVMWAKHSQVPVPFFRQGLVVVNETRIIVTINEGLSKRYGR
jgi:hypothetical protein